MKFIIFNFISLFYLFFIFIPLTFGLYLESPTFLLYVLSICICSDIGGYITGRTIGGKKLTKISPKKTISGSAGSFCFSILPLLLFYNFDQFKYLYSIDNFILCIQISLVCQLGDLYISYIKRKAKVKDSGKILPGHGGLLDRIDGIIFAIPFVQIYLVGFNGYIEMWKYVIFH
jgi:phosphatidate cytidylyltransferase